MYRFCTTHPLILFCCAVLLFVSGVIYYLDIELLGFQGAEVYGHAWTHTWRFEDIPASFMGTQKTIGTEHFPIIDFIPALFSHFFHLFWNWSTSYNAMVIAFILLGIIGMYQLAESEKADGLSASIILFASPIFWGSINSGLTEDFAIGLVGLILAFRNKNPWLLGLLLGVLPYCGLVLAFMGGVLLFALWLLDYANISKDWILMKFKTILTAFLMTIPLFFLHQDRLLHKGHRDGQHVIQENPFWMLNPWKHNDVASLFYYGSPNFEYEIIRLHPSSIGLIGLFLIWKSGCKTFSVLFLFCTFLSFGPEFYWMGQSTGIPNPFTWLLNIVPGYDLLNHQGRWMLMSLISFSVLAAKGIQNIKYGRYLLLAILIEWWCFGPMGFVIKGTANIESSILSKLPESNRIIRLPMTGPNISFQKPLWEQHIHQQAMWLNPNHPGLHRLMKLSEQSMWLEELGIHSTIPNDFCIPDNIKGILVAQPYISMVAEKLNQPLLEDDNYAFWSIGEDYKCEVLEP